MSEETGMLWDMIVQLPITGFWGTDAEMDLRDGISDSMERQLSESGLGQFDGSDCGSGTVNFFTYNIQPDNWERVVEMWLAELRRREIAEKALIVKSIWIDEDDTCQWTVVWPADFQGTFSLF